MRILLLTETLPFPLDSGGRIKTFHTLRMLAGAHEVHCHALTRAPVVTPPAPLTAICASVTVHPVGRGWLRELASVGRALGRRAPFTVVRHADQRAMSAIQDAADRLKPDLVYCDHLSMYPYAARVGRPMVHDAHNVEWRLVQRYGKHAGSAAASLWAAREWRALRSFERNAYRESALVLATSDTDRLAIDELTDGQAAVSVVPIAMDVRAFRGRQEAATRPRMLFLGGLHWPPNADAVDWFSRDVLPLVRASVPEAEVLVVGRSDGAMASRVQRRPGVTLAGAVAEIADAVQSSQVMAVPLRSGSGTRVKILDAFARGLPVVSTSIGCEGLRVSSGRELLVADEPRAFADALLRVMQDATLAQTLATAGYEYLLGHHDLAVVGPRLLEAVAAAAGRAS